MHSGKVFVAYPSAPSQIGQTLKEAARQIASVSALTIIPWEGLDIPGNFIVENIFNEIDGSEFVIADITRLNFNVTFEIGYAIGKGKRAFLLVNRALQPDTRSLRDLGVFDTLGHKEYENSDELSKAILSVEDIRPLRTDHPIDKSTPIYILDTLHKTDPSLRIIAKIKKSGIKFRSHDPTEQYRLPLNEAYKNVKQSIAVVIHLLSNNSTDYLHNNLKGAFLAGLSYGLNKDLLILQDNDGPIPLDYRDFVSVYKNYEDIDRHINEFAPRVIESLQYENEFIQHRNKALLANIDLGAPAAENEMVKLGNYYVDTDEHKQVLNGSIRLAVGRKGSGKTALFFQVRDQLRRDKRRIVLDLKPEGHQLKRLKDLVMNNLGDSVQEHVATAFWEYVLLLEICYKLLEKDRKVHLRDHKLYEPYQTLSNLYSHDTWIGEADFSERILSLVNRISSDFNDISPDGNVAYLSAPQVTELIYKHDISSLREHISEYLKLKQGVVMLFDNIDKGWPTRGIQPIDIVILRALLEATRKLERYFQGRSIQFQSTVFIRNDVFELLADESPDRGKESKVSLDWTDKDLLREFLRRRLVYNEITNENFEDSWNSISISHIRGVNSADFLIERSLMRPRNLLSLVNYCKSNAVNLQHKKIDESDIEKAISNYSSDILHEIGFEIRDVFPDAEDILYHFIGVDNYLSLDGIYRILKESEIKKDSYENIVEVLIWFSFLGVVSFKNEEPTETYIYDVYYDIKKLKMIAGNFKKKNTIFAIHSAFWPVLEINVTDYRRWASYTSQFADRRRKGSSERNDPNQLKWNF